MEALFALPSLALIAGLAMAGWGWLNDDAIRHQRAR